MGFRRYLGRALLRTGAALLVLLSLVVGLIIGGVLWLRSPAGNAWMRKQLERQIESALHEGDVKIEAMRTDLYRSATLRGFSIALDGEPVIAVEGAELQLRTRKLLRGRLPVEVLKIEGPKVALSMEAVERLKGPSEEDEPDSEPWSGLPIAISGAPEIVDGELRWLQDGVTYAATDLALTGRLYAEGLRIEGRALALTGALSGVEDESLSLSLSGAFVYDDDALDVQEAVLTLGESRAVIDGDVLGLDDAPWAEASLELEPLAMADLQSLLGDLGLQGALRGSLEVSGDAGRHELEGALGLAEGAAALSAELDLSPEVPGWRVGLDVDSLEVGDLVTAVTEPILLTGELELAGQGLDEDMSGAGALTLRAPVIWGYAFDAVTAELGLSLGEAGDPRLQIETSTLTGDWGIAHAEGPLDLDGVDLGLDAEIASMVALKTFGVEGLSGSGAADGQLSVDWSGDVVTVEFDGSVTGAGVAYDGITSFDWIQGPVLVSVIGDDVTASGTARTGAVSVMDAAGGTLVGAESAVAEWRAFVAADGSVSWSAKPKVKALTIQGYDFIDIEGSDRLLEAASGVARGSVSPSGVSETQVDLELGRVLPGRFGWGAGALALSIVDDQIDVGLEIRDEDHLVSRLALRYGMGDGLLSLNDLSFGLPGSAAWALDRASSVRLSEDGSIAVDLGLASDAGRLDASGALNPHGQTELLVTIEDMDLEWLALVITELEGVSGEVSAEISARGAYGDPVWRGDVSFAKLTVPGSVERIDGALRFDDEDRRLHLRGDVQKDGPILLLSGNLPVDLTSEGVTFAREGALEAELILTPGPLERLTSAFPALEGLTGQGSAQILLGGTATSPEADIKGLVQVPLGDQPRWGRLVLDASTRGEQISLSAIGEEVGYRRLEISGIASTKLPQITAWFAGVDGVVEPNLEDVATFIDDLAISVIPQALPLSSLAAVAALPDTIEGELAGALGIFGHPLKPEIAGGLQLSGARFGEVAVEKATLQLEPKLDGYVLDLDMIFEPDAWAREALEAETDAPLNDDGAGDFNIHAFLPFSVDLEDDFDLDEQLARPGFLMAIKGEGLPAGLLSVLDPEIQNVRGLLAVEGMVAGSANAPEPDLEIALSDGGFDYAPVGLRFQSLQLDGALSDGRLRVPRFSLQSIPLRAVEGGFDVVSLLDTSSQAGALSGSLEVLLSEGPRAETEGERIRRESAGEPAPTELKAEVSASLALDHFWLSNTSDTTLQVSSDNLAIGDTWPALSVTGDIMSDRSRLVMNEDFWLGQRTLLLDPAIQIERPNVIIESDAPREEEPPFWEAWAIDVRVDLNQQGFLKVAMPMDASYGQVSAALSTVRLDSRIDGDLRIGQRGGELQLGGEVTTLRGEAEVLGKKFAISEGLIIFSGADYANPLLNMTATHTNREYGDISVRITEPVESMEVSFDSSEGFDELDIMSILVMGAPASQLTQSEGGVATPLLTLAMQTFSSQASNVGISNLDVLEIESSDGQLVSSVRAGRAIGDDLFLILGADLSTDREDDENAYEVIVEWLISRQVYAEFVTGDVGETSADIYRRWRF